MLSIAAIVLCLALVFVYRALHPALHPIPALAKRVRVGLGGLIMILSVAAGYSLPVEVGRGLQRLNEHQAQQQSDRIERRMAAEQRHAARMIELFGSADTYLTYLNSKTAQKTPF
jgi:uncharacterized membrane protein